MRRLLAFAYLFPPLGGAGVQRTVKFVKYLPEYGYQTTVVTTGQRWYAASDESLWDELPRGLRVLRARELSWARQLSVRLEARGLASAAAAAQWPDLMGGWVPAAVALGLREARRCPPEVLYSTSPPASNHVAALIVSRLTGIPWVADFRDEWASNPEATTRPDALRAVDRAAERAVARRCDRVVVVADHYAVGGQELGDPKRVTIPNGVDPADLRPMATVDGESQHFRITYVGTLYEKRDCRPVLRALERLARRGAVDPREVELRVVGNVWLRGGLGSAGPIPIRETGYVDHERALREMASATLLLSYAPTGDRGVAGKIYEYLVSGVPILCVAPPDNRAHRLVREMGAGWSVDPEQPAAIEAAIEDAYHRWKEGRLSLGSRVRDRTLEQYSRRALTGRLVEVLDATRRVRPRKRRAQRNVAGDERLAAQPS
jgi:glycosyltransferase involved in cell wall biosynthesis